MLKDNLKKLREAKGLTKKQVALGVGITERAYIAYEYGERDVSTETLAKLADFYNVTTDYLLGREEREEPSAIDKLVQEENLRGFEKAILEQYLELSDKHRIEVEKFVYKAFDKAKGE